MTKTLEELFEIASQYGTITLNRYEGSYSFGIFLPLGGSMIRSGRHSILYPALIDVIEQLENLCKPFDSLKKLSN